MRRLGRILSCGVLVLWAGCSSSPEAPSGALDGTWSGTMTGDGGGGITLVLAQNGAGIAGTFQWRSTDGTQTRAGEAGGTLAGSVLSLSLSGTPLVCPGGITLSGVVSATVTVNGSRMAGSYAAFTCGGAAAGTVEVARQPG
jgi:hypothetical protein